MMIIINILKDYLCPNNCMQCFTSDSKYSHEHLHWETCACFHFLQIKQNNTASEMSLSQLLPHHLWCPFRSTQQQQAVSLLLSPCYMLCRWVSLYSLKSLLVCWQQVATGGRWHTVEERGHRWEQEEACSLQQQLTKRNPSAEWSGGEWTFMDMYFMILDCICMWVVDQISLVCMQEFFKQKW